VGGGLILEGKLYRGATGSAGEIGHTKVADPGEPCNCGGHGCLEAYAGNYGIVRTARRIMSKDPDGGRVLQELCPNMDLLTPKHLTEAAERGDAVARRVWQQTGHLLGLGLSNMVLVVNPEALLILGGVSQAGRWLLDPVQAHLSKEPFRTPFSAATVKMAANPQGGCVGAALLAMEAGR
jgi:glucokinase